MFETTITKRDEPKVAQMFQNQNEMPRSPLANGKGAFGRTRLTASFR